MKNDGMSFRKGNNMKKYHDIGDVHFTDTSMFMIVDDKEFKFDLRNLSTRLAEANEEEKNKYEISPSGYGIHWPLIDEDLSIDGLLGIVHTPQDQKISA